MFDQWITPKGRLSSKQPQNIKNQWYIQKFQEIHGALYDYSNVNYSGALTKVEIICNTHGSFFQTPNHHVEGKGCPKCQGNVTKTTEQCILDFQYVHGYTYNYSRVYYTSIRNKVEIICKTHGAFYQTPDHHQKGHGCPKCQNQSQDILYILKCMDTGLYKIGITSNLKQRILGIGGNLEHVYHIKITNPRNLEKYLHIRYKKFREFNSRVRSGGTEFFKLTEEQIQDIIKYLYSL